MRRRRYAVLVPGPSRANPRPVGRSPRAGLVSLHPGGSGHRAGRHYDRSARCLLDWDWAKQPSSQEARPGAEAERPPRASAESRTWSAARRARRSQGARRASHARTAGAPRGAPSPSAHGAGGTGRGSTTRAQKRAARTMEAALNPNLNRRAAARPHAGVALCRPRGAQARGQAQCSARRRHAHDAALAVRAVPVLARLRGRPNATGRAPAAATRAPASNGAGRCCRRKPGRGFAPRSRRWSAGASPQAADAAGCEAAQACRAQAAQASPSPAGPDAASPAPAAPSPAEPEAASNAPRLRTL